MESLLKKIFLVSLIFCSFLSSYGKSNLIHKKVEYSNFSILEKANQSEFLSNFIDVPIVKPDPFLAVGFQANLRSNLNNAEIFLRVSVDKKEWTDWQLVHNEFHGENSEANYLAELSFFEKDTKYIQFKISSDTKIESIVFNFISPGSSSQVQNKIQLTKENFDSNIDRPAYVSRKEWNSPQDEHISSRTLTDVTHLIIHHSAGNTTSNDFAAVVLAYWDYHVNGHGWDDIGYNWLVDPNGVLYKGRAWKSETEENIQGAHNSAKNGNTSGICLIGNYVSSTPSEKGLDKLASICAFLCSKYDIDPLGKSYHASIEKVNDNITGHGQSGGGTACPGTQLINRMQTLREMTKNKNYDITAAPGIISSYPSTEYDSVYLSKDIVVEFSHPMDTNSVESAFTIVPEVSGEISWNDDGTILKFKSSLDLLSKTNYILTISQNGKSKWDVPLENNVEISFVTKSSDNLSLVSNFPIDGAVDVARDLTIELIFDGPLEGSSLGGNILFLDANFTNVNLNVDLSGYNDGILRFSPSSLLDENSTYFVELKENISSTENYTFGKTKVITFVTETITSINSGNTLPGNFVLLQNYPNPFNPSTRIRFSLPQKSFVSLEIYNSIGEEIKTLISEEVNAGFHEVDFYANGLPNGIYFYKIVASDFVQTKKMLLLK